MLFNFVLLLMSLLSVIFSSEIEFDKKMEKANTPELLLIQLLSHPDHSILPADESFFSKPALFKALADFANDPDQRVDDLGDRLIEKWEQKVPRGRRNEADDDDAKWESFGRILKSAKEMSEEAQLDNRDRVKTLLLGLYGLGETELDGILESGELLEAQDDKFFVNELKKVFHKALCMIAGFNCGISEEKEDNDDTEIVKNLLEIKQRLSTKYSIDEEERGEIRVRSFYKEEIKDKDDEMQRMFAQLIGQTIDGLIKVNGQVGQNDEIKNDEILADDKTQEDNEDTNSTSTSFFSRLIGSVKNFFLACF